MKSWDSSRGRRRRRFLALWLGIVAALAVAIIAGLYAGPAGAHPGNTCDPEPGHGTPGCHVDTASSTGGSKPSDGATTSGSTPTPTTGQTSPVVPSSGPQSAPSDPNTVQMFVDQNSCLACHGDPALANLMTYKRADGSTIALYVDRGGLANSVHRYKDCSACHTTTPHDTKSPLTKLSSSQKCGSCHEYEYNQYKNSVHGAPQASGNSDPATCTDCHSETSNPHNIVRVLDASATAYPKNVATTCAKCHDNPSLMDKYGIVEKVYASYMRSFHGKAIKLASKNAPIQQLDTATCASCHGAHNISSVTSPASPVAGMDNLLGTCRTCHPTAGAEFVNGFMGHKAVNSDYLPQVYYTGKGFYVFTRAMLAGGIVIVGTSITLRGVPWISRRVKRSKKKEA